MERQIQLTLTYDEATILGSVTALGLKTLDGDKERMKNTKRLLNLAIELWPEASIPLAEKMIAVNKSVSDYALEERRGVTNEIA